MLVTTVPIDQRIRISDELKSHPYLKRSFAKLGLKDWSFVTAWIYETQNLDSDDLMFASNRLFIDQTDEVKPKNWKIICEFASCFSTLIKQRETDTHSQGA